MTDPTPILLQVFAVLFGLVIGSFLNVAIARLPEDRSVVTPRSHCPWCGTTLSPPDLVPVLSWLWLRGRCRHCKGTISPSYPLIEILTALLAWLVYQRVFGADPVFDPAHVVAWLLWFTFLCLLLVAAYVDVRHWIIPDETSIYAVPLGILGALALQALGWEAFPAITWRESVTGALVGGSVLATASLVAMWVLGREALGWGDVKLMAMIGAFVGPLPVVFLVLLPASLIGSIASLAHLAWTRSRGYLPYGPSLALAAALYILYGDWIASRYFPGIAFWMGLVEW